MLPLEYAAIAIVVLLIGAQLWLRPYLVRIGPRLFWLLTALIVLFLIYEIHQAFVDSLVSSTLVRYLVPPYVSISFFLFSSWSRLIAPYFFSWLLAFGVNSLLHHTARYRERFEPEERDLIPALLLLTRFPLSLLYLGLAPLIFAALASWRTRRYGPHCRTSFVYGWAPIAAVILIAAPYLFSIPVVALISFANPH